MEPKLSLINERRAEGMIRATVKLKPFPVSNRKPGTLVRLNLSLGKIERGRYPQRKNGPISCSCPYARSQDWR
jgi:hypothetical protein